MIDKLLKFFGFHVHQRKLFLIGDIALVKCVDCGAESFPWEVPPDKVIASSEDHKDDAKLYCEIDARNKGI